MTTPHTPTLARPARKRMRVGSPAARRLVRAASAMAALVASLIVGIVATPLVVEEGRREGIVR